jgi:hypothetical protein
MSVPFFSRATPPITYGITPPKRSTPPERCAEIASRQAARIAALPIDALVVYDLQDESSRTDAERPFPFVACVDSAEYAFDALAAVRVPKVVYRGVSGDSPESLEAFFTRVASESAAAVLVGAPSRTMPVRMGLRAAYARAAEHVPRVPLGGVTIAERHTRGLDEHLRALAKVDAGCSFLVSQTVYSVTASKDLLSDLVYQCRDEGREVPIVLVTLSPCGSAKTLAFMRWLGISVPRWLENDLLRADDTLQASVEVSLAIFEEILAFTRDKGIPLGCNIESVSLARAEIDASVEMVQRVATLMRRSGTALDARPRERS